MQFLKIIEIDSRHCIFRISSTSEILWLSLSLSLCVFLQPLSHYLLFSLSPALSHSIVLSPIPVSLSPTPIFLFIFLSLCGSLCLFLPHLCLSLSYPCLSLSPAPIFLSIFFEPRSLFLSFFLSPAPVSLFLSFYSLSLSLQFLCPSLYHPCLSSYLSLSHPESLFIFLSLPPLSLSFSHTPVTLSLPSLSLSISLPPSLSLICILSPAHTPVSVCLSLSLSLCPTLDN